MKVLDLFAGEGGWSAYAKDAGHDVITVDYSDKFDTTFRHDLRDAYGLTVLLDGWQPDIILASPPCEGFTVMNIGKNWEYDLTPKSPTAKTAIETAMGAIKAIDIIKPTFWVIENPRGMMRKMPWMQDYERRTVTYCQLGEQRMKPTDLWGTFPPSLVLPEPCKNGDPCHVRAPRGTKTKNSTQGIKEASKRALVPYELSRLVIQAAERDI